MEQIAYPSVCVEEITQILKYFGVFQYPLTLDEIYNLSGKSHNKQVLKEVLCSLEEEGIIGSENDFYFWGNNKESINKRQEGEQRASHLLPKAFRIGKLISRFPFVKFVGISGSLSKGFARPDADFDYFIITDNNTLWISRTILHCFKKLTFLVGLQHWFCMNYFIDCNHLEIEEKNIFTQMELMTLIPVNNLNLYAYLLLKNNIPNSHKMPFSIPTTDFVQGYERVFHKERNKWLKPINLLLMKITDWKWKRKWKAANIPESEYKICFKTTPYVSKNHPRNYQKQILEKLSKA